ncbi:MAG: ABC transporter ATP-binding protein [Desulfamplus sp.]|nr:ABC transporter ATP-binding protein [Desulfamplus sp.]
MGETEHLLEIKDLETFFYTEDGIIRACDRVSYTMDRGETLAVVGESGSGKSVTAMSILNLIPDPPGRIVGGEILFKGKNLVGMPSHEMRKIRGNEIAMIFQEPMTSLNPVMTAGKQISESLMLHRNMNNKKAMEKAVEMLEMVGIPAPASRVDEYPHQMSGGMRQRVMIAIALACNPSLLIADEPTSALDVTIQAQILRLIKKLQKELGMSVILITHDMGVVAETADRVAVMYCGTVVEYGNSRDIFFNPMHPYLKALQQSVLTIEDKPMQGANCRDDEKDKPMQGANCRDDEKTLYIIEGDIPDPLNLPRGCRFEPRCLQRMEICKTVKPEPAYMENGHYACCHLHSNT